MKTKEKESIDFDSKRNEFDWYIEELNKIYINDEGRAKKIARRGLRELGFMTKNSSSNSHEIDKQITIIVVLCILIALCCFFAPNVGSMGMYIFGVIFFIAGLFTGLNVPGAGLIFLFSHGGTGLFIMIISLFGMDDSMGLEKIFNNPVFTDGGIHGNILIYLIIMAIIFVVAIIYTILHNLSPKLKEDKKHIIRILLLFLIGILLLAIFPKIFPYVI